MRDKRATAGEGILTIYRLVLISFIALIILGISAVFYDYYIDVRATEAGILTKQVVNCLAPKGIVDWDGFPKDKKNNILDYCEIGNTERFYVKVDLREAGVVSGSGDITLEHGDSGATWVKDLFAITSEESKYAPGYSQRDYNITLIKDGKTTNSKMDVFVLVSHEF